MGGSARTRIPRRPPALRTQPYAMAGPRGGTRCARACPSRARGRAEAVGAPAAAQSTRTLARTHPPRASVVSLVASHGSTQAAEARPGFHFRSRPTSWQKGMPRGCASPASNRTRRTAVAPSRARHAAAITARDRMCIYGHVGRLTDGYTGRGETDKPSIHRHAEQIEHGRREIEQLMREKASVISPPATVRLGSTVSAGPAPPCRSPVRPFRGARCAACAALWDRVAPTGPPCAGVSGRLGVVSE
jgi:hypothetical protein